MKSAVLVSVLALTAFAVLEESAAARTYLNCVSKKVVFVDAPKGTTSSTGGSTTGLSGIGAPAFSLLLADDGTAYAESKTFSE
jgi:hypothetical protein